MRCRLRSSRYKTCFLLHRPPHPAKIKDFCHLRSAERPVGGSDSPQDCHSLPPTALCLPQGEGLAAAPQSFTQLLDKRKLVVPALNRVVGHEITHILDGTDLYDSLAMAVAAYAKTKGEYESRLQQIRELYKGKEGYTGEEGANTRFQAELNAEAKFAKELIADFVGDYLFTDKQFVEKLFNEDRGLFNWIRKQIDYIHSLCKAGSKEARQLAKCKKVFTEVAREASENGVKNPTGEGGVKYSLYSRPSFSKEEWSIVNRRKHSEFDNPKYDLDENHKWMYAKEKGLTVFAVYSKADADDPTVLYGSSEEQAETDYAELNSYFRGEYNAKSKRTNRNRATLDRVLATINRIARNEGTGVYSPEGGFSETGDVQFPVEKSAGNGGSDFGEGAENRWLETVTEDEEASDDSDASSVTWSNDYATIRNFMKDGILLKDSLSSPGQVEAAGGGWGCSWSGCGLADAGRVSGKRHRGGCCPKGEYERTGGSGGGASRADVEPAEPAA